MLYMIFQYDWELVLIQRILIGFEAILDIRLFHTVENHETFIKKKYLSLLWHNQQTDGPIELYTECSWKKGILTKNQQSILSIVRENLISFIAYWADGQSKKIVE